MAMASVQHYNFQSDHETFVCVICQQAVRIGERISKIVLCDHSYYRNCLNPWARNSENPTCPLRCCRFDRELVESIPENERRTAAEEVGRMAEDIAFFATERAAHTAEIAHRAAGEVPRRAAEAARMAAEEEEARNIWGQVILNARPNESRVWELEERQGETFYLGVYRALACNTIYVANSPPATMSLIRGCVFGFSSMDMFFWIDPAKPIQDIARAWIKVQFRDTWSSEGCLPPEVIEVNGMGAHSSLTGLEVRRNG